MIKKILIIIITFLITLLVINKASYVLRPAGTDPAYSQIETLHALPKNTIDVMIYGSSHAIYGVNTKRMNEIYGIKSYNYGMYWQGISTTKLFIQDSLKYQTPKIAFVECYLANRVVKNQNSITPEVYYSRYFDDCPEKTKYLKKCFGNNYLAYLAYYFPIIEFHENWETLDKTCLEKLSVDEKFYNNMGYDPKEEIFKIKISDPNTFNQYSLNDDALIELNEIVDLLHQKDVEIVLFTLPYQGEFNYSEALKSFANENDCIYLDLFNSVDEIGLNEDSDFFNEDHINLNGASKVSDYLSKYILENYKLTY